MTVTGRSMGLPVHLGRCPVTAAVRPPASRLWSQPVVQWAYAGQPKRQQNCNPTYPMTEAPFSLTPASGLVKVPPEVGLDIAALVGCSVTTGYGAVTNTAKVEPGSTVTVIGAGGVGLNIIHTARLVGARRIIAVDLVEEKLDLAKEFGATDAVYAGRGDAVQQVQELTGGGVDYAFEAIGLKQTARQAYDMIRRGGTAVVVGMVPPNDTIEVPGLIWRDEKTLKGSFYGSARFHVDMPRILDLYRQGKLELDRLVTRRFPLEQINEAFDLLKSGGMARSVLDINPE
ncbi:MAG: zinc-binding dehydrogenase [Caldilineaceae bacterium]